MSPWSILLRMALIVVLILNGAGAAATSVAMMQTAVPESASTMVHAMQGSLAMQADMPCHDMAQMAAKVAPGDFAMQTPDHASQDKGKPVMPDCCKSGTCQCSCMQAAHAALPAMLAFALASPHSDVPHPMSTGHADPTLPHLVRPPIG